MSDKYKKLPKWADAFFDAFAKYGSQEAARKVAEKSGGPKSPSSISNWKRYSDAFRLELDKARIRHGELLEAELTRRAMHGRPEQVIYRGQIAYQRNPSTGQLLRDENEQFIPVVIRKYSDALLTLKLRAELPEKYGGTDQLAMVAMRDAKDHEDHEAPSKEEFKKRLRKLREVRKAELVVLDGGKSS